MIKTITTWKKDHQFEGSHEGNKIKMDGSAKHGHGPKALLLSALAACSGIDVVDILTKMRVEFSDLVIETRTEQTDENPKIYKGIHLLYNIKTEAENEDKVRKAVDLSLEKYCGVAAMLKKNSKIDYQINVHS